MLAFFGILVFIILTSPLESVSHSRSCTDLPRLIGMPVCFELHRADIGQCRVQSSSVVPEHPGDDPARMPFEPRQRNASVAMYVISLAHTLSGCATVNCRSSRFGAIGKS